MEAEIDEEVEGETRLRRKALRDLVKTGIILRSGRGGKSDPYRYATAQTQANSAGNKNPNDTAPRCRGCKEPFEPLTDGASKTLCRACQAELRRGLRR
jgi:hypothetical protein